MKATHVWLMEDAGYFSIGLGIGILEIAWKGSGGTCERPASDHMQIFEWVTVATRYA